jgi:drug/metabolite transporter (DMT)-like permease
VILWGFTAILGDLIELPAYTIVFWRVLITSISLFMILSAQKKLVWLKPKMLLIYLGIGVLVGLHWITFYGAIKLSNASITLVCFATTSFFTSLVEPLIVRSKFSLLDMGIGLIIIPAMMYIVNDLSSEYYSGILVGISSAILATLFSSLNKKYVDDADPVMISFLEIGAATIFMAICFPLVYKYMNVTEVIPTAQTDWLYIFVLAIACTTLPFILSMIALKELSAFATNLVVNLEPVYGILLAIFILKEHKELNGSFYIGAIIITFSVFLYPVIKKKWNPVDDVV